MEIGVQPRVKARAIARKNLQSFHRTTKKERMQQYYKHIQAKYSGRTSLQTPAEPQHKSASVSSMSAGLSRWSSNDFTMPFSANKTPTQRIGNFSHFKKAWQSQESHLDHTSAATLYNNVSEDHNYHPKYLAHFLPDASEDHRSHPSLSGNPLPKWNNLYKAYKDSP